jgi:hypothetical protein
VNGPKGAARSSQNRGRGTSAYFERHLAIRGCDSDITGAAFALAGRKDGNEVVGASALLIGFFFSFLFSLMLVRQATERRGFVARLRRFEEELDKLHEGMFQPIKSTLESFTSVVLARFLALESFLGFSAAFLFLVSRIGLPF